MADFSDGTENDDGSGEGERLILSADLRVRAPGAAEGPLVADTVIAETAAWPGDPESAPMLLDNRVDPEEARRVPLTEDPHDEEDWQDAPGLDEAALRELIREIVREELETALGDMNMRSIRKMVKREIAKATGPKKG